MAAIKASCSWNFDTTAQIPSLPVASVSSGQTSALMMITLTRVLTLEMTTRLEPVEPRPNLDPEPQPRVEPLGDIDSGVAIADLRNDIEPIREQPLQDPGDARMVVSDHDSWSG